jgi:DEAD/DEAH box helicase domain-containing protein
MNPYLVLDIETQRGAQEVPGGWNNIASFGLAIAVTIDQEGEWEAYDETLSNVLVKELHHTNHIITFNGIRFDYEVLRPYGLKPEFLYHKSYDILVEMQKVLGHRISLESVARATLGEGKNSSGLQAVQWYKEGKIDKVIEYCKKDVDITRRIYEFIKKHSYVQYMSLSGEVRTCSLHSPTPKAYGSLKLPAEKVILSPQRK